MRKGAKQDVTWWNAYTLCPAYQPVIEYHRALVRRIIGEWGFEGLKLDGQHLNAVAPCYNPAHKHARPEESFEKLQDFWKAIYDEAIGDQSGSDRRDLPLRRQLRLPQHSGDEQHARLRSRPPRGRSARRARRSRR
jgi:hypothetical protein